MILVYHCTRELNIENKSKGINQHRHWSTFYIPPSGLTDSPAAGESLLAQGHTLPPRGSLHPGPIIYRTLKGTTSQQLEMTLKGFPKSESPEGELRSLHFFYRSQSWEPPTDTLPICSTLSPSLLPGTRWHKYTFWHFLLHHNGLSYKSFGLVSLVWVNNDLSQCCEQNVLECTKCPVWQPLATRGYWAQNVIHPTEEANVLNYLINWNLNSHVGLGATSVGRSSVFQVDRLKESRVVTTPLSILKSVLQWIKYIGRERFKLI